MAVQFTKTLASDKLLQAFNNNILRFHSDKSGTTEKATIKGFGFESVLYPHPNGSFYFNFKEYISNQINTNNFAMDEDVDFSAPGSTFQKGVDAGLLLSDSLEIKIHFQEAVLTDDVATVLLCFILGAEQITDRFTNSFQNNNSMNILSPLSENGKAYLNFWKGYPFDFSTFLGFDFSLNTEFSLPVLGANITIKNKNRINAIYLSDGLNHLLPTTQQYFNLGSVVINQIDNACGAYVKFLNKFGRWNYWLFEGGHFETRTSKSLGELNNNYNDISETVSPTIEIGKTGNRSIRVQGKRLLEKDKIILEQIIDSPKIYYFIGEKNRVAKKTDWAEVSLKTGSFITQSPIKRVYNYTMEFELPTRDNQTL